MAQRNGPASKRDRIEDLWATARDRGCPAGTGPVLAEGQPDARLMLIGEAPGAQEVKQGRPFAGPAGRLLDRLLEEAGLRRDEVWITNVVKCRPTTEENGRIKNRQPTAAEQKAWKPMLASEVAIVQPEAIVCLGAISAKALFGTGFKITQERGRWRDTEWGIPALVTFHPAYALHLEGTASDEAVATILADFGKVVARLHETIGATGRDLTRGELFQTNDYGEQGRLFE